ncbi:MAG: hypothetical protein ABSF83_04785 [Nitrososphaerales archaeon]
MSLAAFTILLALGMVPAVHAATSTVNSSWCSGAGFSWDSGTSTCTLTTGYGITSGNTLEIPSGTTLTVSGVNGAITIFTGGALTVDSGGVFVIANCCTGGGPPNIGVVNDGTITNNGLIKVEVGTDDTGIDNENAIVNNGTIDVENAGSFTIGILTGEIATSTIDNYGTVNLSNPGTGSIDIDNSAVGAFTNECGGTITGTSFADALLGGYIQATGCTTTTSISITSSKSTTSFTSITTTTSMTTITTSTTGTVSGVPQFPILGPLLLVALALPLVLILSRRSRTPSMA